MIKKRPDYIRNTGLSLIQPNDSGREFLLEKMRGKLAGSSMAHMEAAEKRRVAVRKHTMSWAWRIGVTAALALVNIVWIGSREEAPLKLMAKNHARKLPVPTAAMDVNQQALYWAYALYDFAELKVHFKVPDRAIVNTAMARERLALLLPKLDAPTRATIDRMTSASGGVR
ncbi:MAG: hypothetical protein ABIW76_05070 [Fibrobacteria bacterium]